MSFVSDAMNEFGIFVYNGHPVFGHAIWNSPKNMTSIFSFQTKRIAKKFFKHFDPHSGLAFINGSQVIFFGCYTEVMSHIPEEMIEYRHFSRGGVF